MAPSPAPPPHDLCCHHRPPPAPLDLLQCSPGAISAWGGVCTSSCSSQAGWSTCIVSCASRGSAIQTARLLHCSQGDPVGCGGGSSMSVKDPRAIHVSITPTRASLFSHGSSSVWKQSPGCCIYRSVGPFLLPWWRLHHTADCLLLLHGPPTRGWLHRDYVFTPSGSRGLSGCCVCCVRMPPAATMKTPPVYQSRCNQIDRPMRPASADDNHK